MARAMGSTVEVPSIDEAQRTFDEALAEPPHKRDRVADATLRVFSGKAAA
jgi:hypothetical protein